MVFWLHLSETSQSRERGRPNSQLGSVLVFRSLWLRP